MANFPVAIFRWVLYKFTRASGTANNNFQVFTIEEIHDEEITLRSQRIDGVTGSDRLPG